MFDDPHFRTFSGRFYDFMGECDLRLIDAPNFAGQTPPLSLVINIRTKIRYSYSYITSAVAQIGDSTLEVASFGDYFLDGVNSANLRNQTVAGFPITHTRPSKNVHLFEILLDESLGEKITLKTFKDMVSVKLEKANIIRFQGALGMMGEFGSGRMLARDGATELEDDPAVYAEEWQVKMGEPMLFQTVEGPQHPEKCRIPGLGRSDQRRLGQSVAMKAAVDACAHWDETTRSSCVHDVMATGDLELAAEAF